MSLNIASGKHVTVVAGASSFTFLIMEHLITRVCFSGSVSLSDVPNLSSCLDSGPKYCMLAGVPQMIFQIQVQHEDSRLQVIHPIQDFLSFFLLAGVPWMIIQIHFQHEDSPLQVIRPALYSDVSQLCWFL